MPQPSPLFSFFHSPWFLHLRPRSWPTVAGHAFCGALIIQGWRVFEPDMLWRALLATAVWAICLNGGTLAFNSAIDRDEGDVGFLRSPPPPPRSLGAFGFGVMLIGAVLAAVLGAAYLVIYLVSVALSWLYSAPPARLKTRGGWDVAINMIGYGALTMLAGWVAVAPAPRGTDAGIIVGFGFLFGVVYPMTQFYQREDDRRSGARTLVLLLGDRGSMIFLHAALLCALGSWGIAAVGRGMQGVSFGALGWTCLVLVGGLWLAFSLDWWMRFDRYPHQKGFYRSMVLWAFTNIALVVAFGQAPTPFSG